MGANMNGRVLMKHAISIIIIMFILVGCESEEVHNDKGTSSPSEAITNNELLVTQRKLHDLEETNRILNNRIIEVDEKLNFYANKFSRTEDVINKVTRIEKFEYEMLSDQIVRPPYDGVVFVEDVPDGLVEQEIYMIRSAIQFAGNEFTKVSLWKDRQTALLYIENNYELKESENGWRGFDQMFGFIDNTSTPPRLSHFFSRDDGQVIEFGKYTYEK